MSDRLNYGTFNEGHGYEVVYLPEGATVPVRIEGHAVRSILTQGWIIEGHGIDAGCTVRLPEVKATAPATPWRARHLSTCCDALSCGAFSDGDPFEASR